jgi:hypothetical protein
MMLPTSIIRLSGNFEIEEALSWLNNFLNEVPLSTSETRIVVGYKSSFLSTLLQITVQEKLIIVKTDNMSVLAIAKESLS